MLDRCINTAIVLGASTYALTKLLTVDQDYWHMFRSGLVGFTLHGSLSHYYYHICEAMRIFVGEPVWTPYNRPHDHLPARKEYLDKLLKAEGQAVEAR